MHLFYYGKVSSEVSQKLLRTIDYHESAIEIYQTVTALTKRLKQINAKPELFVFAPETNQDLSELIAQKDLFQDHPIILVLPNRQTTTIRNAHLLMPRFLSFWDHDLSEVGSVLEKIERAQLIVKNEGLA